MYEWGVSSGLKVTCWRCTAHSPAQSSLSHGNTSLSLLLICSQILPYNLQSLLFLSLLTLSLSHLSACLLNECVQQGQRPGVRRLISNTKLGLCLKSSGKSAVAVPPAYKCTCRSQSHGYCAMFFCLISACILQSPALWPATMSPSNRNLLHWE